jgi:excisionase family DNA binding protein
MNDNTPNGAASARAGLRPLLTVNDVAACLRVTPRTVARMVRRGELPRPLKLGGSIRWQPEAIEAALTTRDAAS